MQVGIARHRMAVVNATNCNNIDVNKHYKKLHCCREPSCTSSHLEIFPYIKSHQKFDISTYLVTHFDPE